MNIVAFIHFGVIFLLPICCDCISCSQLHEAIHHTMKTKAHKTYQVGERISILPEWAEENENSFPLIVIEDMGNRVLILKDLGWRVNPTECILKEYIA